MAPFFSSKFKKYDSVTLSFKPGKYKIYAISGVIDYRSKTFNKNEFFYDYGKKEIKDKRKMGHLTILKK